MKRAVRTAGSNPQQLYQLLQQNSASNLSRAAEIARTILRRVRRVETANRSENNYRLEALRVLQRAGELQPMIQKAEQQLADSPDSLKLMEDLTELYTAAGFEWRDAGCSMCLGMNPDILQPGERCASTSNRNFEGRQGRGGRTHLVSPVMAVAAAIAGRFVDVREVLD